MCVFQFPTLFSSLQSATGQLLTQTRPLIKCARIDPGVVTPSTTRHPLLKKRKHRNEIVLAPSRNVAPVRRPTTAEQAPEIALHGTDQLYLKLTVVGIGKAEHAQVAVLGNNRQIGTTRTEGKLVYSIHTRTVDILDKRYRLIQRCIFELF